MLSNTPIKRQIFERTDAISNHVGPGAITMPSVPVLQKKRIAQRKIKLLSSGDSFDNVKDATDTINVECTPLAKPIASPHQYTVKNIQSLQELAKGNEEQILLPYKHLIGEVHTASQFDRIKNEWPGIPSMGEGFYTVKENNLALPATRGESHNTFEQSIQSRGATDLPLENFHSAALARLTGFLIIWNEFQVDQSVPNVQDHIKKRVPDMKNLFNAYLNVSTGVFIRGKEDEQWYQLWPNYKGDIEKKYGKMFDILNTEDAKSGMTLLDSIRKKIDQGQPIPVIIPGQFQNIRKLVNAIIPAIGDILNTSLKGHPNAGAISAGTSAVSSYIKTNSAALRGTDMQHALDQVNPIRELLMKEQIKNLAKPGLVKVGRAHIPGLTGLHIADTQLYNDAADFDQALNKKAKDL